MTTKRICFAVLCVLLVLMIVLFAVVLSRVSTLFSALSANPATPSTPPAGDSSTVSPSENTDPTASTEVTEPTEGTEPTRPTEHVHEYEYSSQIAPTCDGYGWKIYKCATCGHENLPIDERMDPLGHDLDEGVLIEPTCTEEGCTLFSCTRCSHAERKDVVPALEHEFDEGVAVEASCGVDAHILVTCTQEGCGHTEMVDIVPDTATGLHEFGPWKPTEDGKYRRECTVCHTEEISDTAPEVYTVTGGQEPVPNPNGSGVVYSITVGTAANPGAYTYTVIDQLNNGTLTFLYDQASGLILTYTDTNGQAQTCTLPKESNQTVTIDPTGSTAGG